MGPVLRDVADENQCTDLGGSVRQPNRTDLRDPPVTPSASSRHGLHRVDDDQCRLHRLDLVEHGVHVNCAAR